MFKSNRKLEHVMEYIEVPPELSTPLTSTSDFVYVPQVGFTANWRLCDVVADRICTGSCSLLISCCHRTILATLCGVRRNTMVKTIAL